MTKFKLNLFPWRTLAYQEVRLRIGPLAKLGRFKYTLDNFLVYIIITISLASGPIQSLTSWYAKVLHALPTVRTKDKIEFGWVKKKRETTKKERKNIRKEDKHREEELERKRKRK